MESCLVVTITSPDKPGIVEKVTAVIVHHSGSWLESRMARLGGDFAGIVRVCVPANRVADLIDSMENLSDDELTVTVRPVGEFTTAQTGSRTTHTLAVEGADHEGIVHNLVRILARDGINVERMDTELDHAPMSATPLFRMNAKIQVPPATSTTQLQERLEAIGDRLGIDITLSCLARPTE